MTENSTERAAKSFQTHANYLRAFSRLVPADVIGGGLEPLRAQFKKTAQTGGTCVDAAAVLNSLRMAWRTELLLDFTSAAFDDDEFVRIANTWSVVQVYYVFYHATQALVQAKGQPRTPNHPQTQSIFKALWSDRSIDLPPWSLAHTGTTVRNFPKSVPLIAVHSWANCDDTTRWQLAALALRTTREEAVERAYASRRAALQKGRRKSWEQDESSRLSAGKKPRKRPAFTRPNLSVAEKHSAEQTVRANTIMDYLYRLRIRTNYEDSAMFTDGPTEAAESLQVRQCLRHLSASTLLVHELAIADIMGSEAVADEARAFLKTSTPPGSKTRLSRRLELLEAHRQ